MLTEPEQLLLAAAVDGDLPPTEAKALARLLAAKPDAVRLLARLNANAERVRALPRGRAPAHVLQNVMARVQPATPSTHRPPSRRPNWLPYLIAASVLLTFAAGSALFFRATTAAETEQAQSQLLPPPGHTLTFELEASDSPRALAKGGPTPEVNVTSSKPTDGDAAVAKGDGLPKETVVAKTLPDPTPPLTPKQIELFGSGLMIDRKPLRKVEPALPVVFSALEADAADIAAKLKEEFARGGVCRLDLFSKNAAAAVEQLQAAAKAAGVNVFLDAATAEQLKKPAGVVFAVVIENCTADELTALLAAVSKGAGGTARASEGVFGTAALLAADGSIPTTPSKVATEGQMVKAMLGTDFVPAKPIVKSPDGKPLSDGTLKEIVGSVKKSEKAAVVVTPSLTTPKSGEVKQFLDKRGDRKPDSVPLLVLVRPV